MGKELVGYLPPSVVTFGAAAYQRPIYDPARSPREVTLLADKALHTGRVFLLAQDLLKRIDPEQTKFDWGLVASIAYLHDVARPDELLETGGYGASSNYDHGKEGQAKVLQAGLDLDGSSFTPEMIGVAIAHHNQQNINGVSEELLPYVCLIRDIDKLDNIFFVRGDYWEFLRLHDPYLVPSRRMTRAVWRKFADPGLVSIPTGELKTFSDRLLYVLGWFFELYFPQTVDLLVEERIPERIFELMEDLGVSRIRRGWVKRIFSSQTGLEF